MSEFRTRVVDLSFIVAFYAKTSMRYAPAPQINIISLPVLFLLLRLFFFRTNHSKGEFPRGLPDKHSHLFICISLKWTLSSGQKAAYNVKILVSEQIAFATVLYLGQVLFSAG